MEKVLLLSTRQRTGDADAVWWGAGWQAALALPRGTGKDPSFPHAPLEHRHLEKGFLAASSPLSLQLTPQHSKSKISWDSFAACMRPSSVLQNKWTAERWQKPADVLGHGSKSRRCQAHRVASGDAGVQTSHFKRVTVYQIAVKTYCFAFTLWESGQGFFGVPFYCCLFVCLVVALRCAWVVCFQFNFIFIFFPPSSYSFSPSFSPPFPFYFLFTFFIYHSFFFSLSIFPNFFFLSHFTPSPIFPEGTL